MVFEDIFVRMLDVYPSGVWVVVDGVLYVWLFSVILKESAGKAFEKSGASLAKGLGLALGLSMLFLEYQIGFRLLQLWPYALAVLLIACWLWLYKRFSK